MPDESQAKQRFFMLGLIRLLSAVLTGVGLAIVAGKIDAPRPAGVFFAVFGLLEFVLLPLFLARKWKSPQG